MGKFIISQRANGDYQFRLIASNGETVLSSEGYKTKSSCMKGIMSLINNSQEDNSFIRRTSSNGLFYFNLRATNGEIIGTSELYASESGRESGIYSVKMNAKSNIIVER